MELHSCLVNKCGRRAAVESLMDEAAVAEQNGAGRLMILRSKEVEERKLGAEESVKLKRSSYPHEA